MNIKSLFTILIKTKPYSYIFQIIKIKFVLNKNYKLSHQLSTASAIKIIVLIKGKIEQMGMHEELICQPIFVQDTPTFSPDGLLSSGLET